MKMLILVVTDYRKEHTYNSESEYFEYKDLEDGRCYRLDDIDLKILNGEYFVMATSAYKTEILRKSGLKLLENTFYVDNAVQCCPDHESGDICILQAGYLPLLYREKRTEHEYGQFCPQPGAS